MRTSTRTFTRLIAGVAGLAALAVGLSGCSDSGSADGAGDTPTVTFRIWSDDAVAAAYEKSFDAFTKANPDITVKVNQVPWANYWDKLRTDLSAGGGDDIFWTNAYNFAPYADNAKLVNVSSKLSNEVDAWEPSAVKQYTRKGSLWGVPQLIDGGKVLYYNKELVEKAGVDLTDLAWNPEHTADDTFLPALKKLTVDAAGRTADEPGFDGSNLAQYGFNASNDFDAIIGNFVGSNGGLYQSGGKYTFASNAKAEQAIEYVVNLVDKYHVAPSAADTNGNGDFTRDQFLQGKLAVFESGSYNLATIHSSAKFDWGIAPIPAGPAGRIPVTNSIIAAGNAGSKHADATLKVLRWIGSEKGSLALGASGSLIPAVTAAQGPYFDYWTKQGVDAKPFVDGVADGTLKNDVIPNAAATADDLTTALDEIFAGRSNGSVAAALKAAQTAANAGLSE
ncbi:MAG: sugar ABC transporter substrate-binding protein [Lacisediminihabitans sp.]